MIFQEPPLSAVDGMGLLNSYFGYFFIEKCFGTPGTIRSNATSIRKFYEFLMHQGKMTESDYQSVRYEIKEGMDEWIEKCMDYDSLYE